jgi:hypothetical protein
MQGCYREHNEHCFNIISGIILVSFRPIKVCGLNVSISHQIWCTYKYTRKLNNINIKRSSDVCWCGGGIRWHGDQLLGEEFLKPPNYSCFASFRAAARSLTLSLSLSSLTNPNFSLSLYLSLSRCMASIEVSSGQRENHQWPMTGEDKPSPTKDHISIHYSN